MTVVSNPANMLIGVKQKLKSDFSPGLYGRAFSPSALARALADIPLARYAPFSPGIRPAGYGRVSPAWAAVHSNPAHRSGSPPSLLCWIFLAANWLQEADLNRRYTAYEAAVLPLHHPAMCRGLTVPRRYKIGDMPPSGVGADSGNRTHVFGLESRRSAVELHPRVPPKGRVKGECMPPVFPGCQVGI